MTEKPEEKQTHIDLSFPPRNVLIHQIIHFVCLCNILFAEARVNSYLTQNILVSHSRRNLLFEIRKKTRLQHVITGYNKHPV